MLEHVALNQTGFKIPGVAPDARGVLLGKQGAVLLPSVDRLVAFFRLLSDESSLDDILPSLKIHQVRTRLESREFLVVLHATSSYLLDRCARVAALCGGILCTGSGKHYVKYRDRASPLGYDTDALYTGPCDFILYTEAFTQGYTRVKEISFAQLLFQLSPRSVVGGKDRDIKDLFDREVLWLTVQKGLGQKMLSYLWRNRVKAAACVVGQGETDSASGQRPALLLSGPEYLLLRVADLPERMLRLFSSVPGIEIYRPVGDNYVVEVGYRHPIRLESCASVFSKDRFYLFSGQRDSCDVLLSPPPLLPAESLIRVHFGPLDLMEAKRKERVVVPTQAREDQVTLRLSYSASRGLRVTATLVPWNRIRWFRQLIYALPPTLLKGYRAAPMEEGIFVVSTQGIDGLPIGDLFQEVAPSIFVPVGMDFLPRVGPEVLSDQVGGVLSKYIVFLPGPGPGESRPISLPHSAFESLGRRALAPIHVSPRQRMEEVKRARVGKDITLVNDPTSAFPLWGFQDGDG